MTQSGRSLLEVFRIQHTFTSKNGGHGVLKITIFFFTINLFSILSAGKVYDKFC